MRKGKINIHAKVLRNGFNNNHHIVTYHCHYHRVSQKENFRREKLIEILWRLWYHIINTNRNLSCNTIPYLRR